MPKKKAQRRAARGEDPAPSGQEDQHAPAPTQEHRQAEQSEPSEVEGTDAHLARRDDYAGLGMSHDAEAPGQAHRQLEEAEPAASGLFNWMASPAASLGSPSLFASPHKLPLFQRSPRGHGAPGSPLNQFSVNSFANIFQSPVRTPMGDALHAALGSRFDTPCSAHQFADSLFSPSPRRSSRLAAAGRGAAADGLDGDAASWDAANGSAQQARGGGTAAGEAVMDALANAQQDDGTDLLQKLLRSPAAMDASDRPQTRSRGAGPSRLGGASARRRCLDFSRTDGPGSLPLARGSSAAPAAAGRPHGGSAAADPFLRSAAPHRADEEPAGQFITIPVPGGAAVPVGVEGAQAATLLPVQPLWVGALQPGGPAEQPAQQLQMLMLPQTAEMQLFVPVAGAAAGDGVAQPMSMQALLSGSSPTEGRARSRGRALRKLIEDDDEQQQQQLQQQQIKQEPQDQEAGAEVEEANAPGSGASDVRRSTRRTRRTAAAAAQEEAAPAPAPAPPAPAAAVKGVQASIVQQAVANTPAGRRRQAAAAQTAASGATASEAPAAASGERQQRSSPAEQSTLVSREGQGLLPPAYMLQLLSGESQASVMPPMTPDELQRQQQTQVTARTCHCKKSRCLKLYCECFANGMFCTNCSCVDCQNTKVNATEVMTRRHSIKQRDPGAFEHKLRSNNSTRKGCNCRKSHCLKKYCECFQLGVRCGDLCKCADCKNIEVEGAVAQEAGSRQQHPVGWVVPPGTAVGTPPMVRSMSRTASEPMGTPQTHSAVGVGPVLMQMASLPQTPASNGPLVLLSLSSPFDAAALAARQHPQLPPNNSTPEMHPPDHFAANRTPNSGRRGASAAAQLGLTANAVQQQLLAAAPKLQQLQQGVEQQGSGSHSHGSSMDGTASGGPATASAPVALRTRHRLSTVSSRSTATVKAEPGTEVHGEQGQLGSQATTPRGGRLQQLQQQMEPEHAHETEGDSERQRSRSRSMSRASTPTSSQLMPPPPRQPMPHAHHPAPAAGAVAVASPAPVPAGEERIIRLGADGPLLKLPAAALHAAPAVQLLAGGVAGIAMGQQQQQQQERDQDPNSQVGVLIYLQDDTGKVSAYYVPTVASQSEPMPVGAGLANGRAVVQTAALPVDAPIAFQPVQQQQQQQPPEYMDVQQEQQQEQQQEHQQHAAERMDVVVLEADESLPNEDSEDMQQASPPRRVTRHAAAAAAAASAKAGPVTRSTPTKRKAAGTGADQDPQREHDTPRASPLKFARSPGGINGTVRTQLFRGAGPPPSPTGMLLRNRALTKDDSPPGVADAMSPTKFLASPSSGRGSTMIRFSPGSTLLSPNHKGSRR